MRGTLETQSPEGRRKNPKNFWRFWDRKEASLFQKSPTLREEPRPRVLREFSVISRPASTTALAGRLYLFFGSSDCSARMVSRFGLARWPRALFSGCVVWAQRCQNHLLRGSAIGQWTATGRIRSEVQRQRCPPILASGRILPLPVGLQRGHRSKRGHVPRTISRGPRVLHDTRPARIQRKSELPAGASSATQSPGPGGVLPGRGGFPARTHLVAGSLVSARVTSKIPQPTPNAAASSHQLNGSPRRSHPKTIPNSGVAALNTEIWEAEWCFNCTA